MSQHDPASYNHRPTDASPTNQHARAPSDIFGLIDDERMLVTIAPYGWRTYLRRELLDEYVVRYENAEGELSGTLTLNHRDARRLVTEQYCEAVWGYLRSRSAWPTDETSEVSDG